MYTRIYKLFFSLALFVFAFTSVFATVPAGYYYFAQNKKKAELKTALHLHCAPMFEFDYGGGPGFTWQGFFFTDRNADNSVIDMYSDSVRYFKGYAAVNGMNIEHSFPKSWWGAYENAAYKDLFHLYPADGITNIVKNNLPMGEVTGTPSLSNGKSKVGKNGFGTTYTDNCFEPADEFKGDFARSYFYVSTIYQNLAPLMQSPMVINNSAYPFWRPWAIDLLMKWNRQDPVSPKELARIETIYGIQGNRNPFIDYPDLAEYIWGADSTKIYPFPAETQPYLVAPRRGESLDFGVILQNDNRTKVVHILGANLSSNLQLSLLHQTATFSLSASSIPASNVISGTDVSITFTPSTAGIVLDTLIIQDGGLTEVLRIPIKALASADFITLEPTDPTPVGGTLNWISDPLATNYRLNVYQGDQQAGDLIISTYVEGSSYNKALELFNGTGKTVDLSKYYLQKQTDGAGLFGSTIQLKGNLENNNTYVLVNDNFNLVSIELKNKAQILDSLINFNGNDPIALVRNGVVIDMVGIANSGPVYWGQDITLQRKSNITHPTAIFKSSEWTTYPKDTYTMLGYHPMTLSPSKNYILQNVLTGLTTNYPIQNLSPENTYTYSIESMRSGIIAPSINTMQLHTTALDAPEISEASNISSHQFTANWGPTAYASGYLLNLFTMNGQGNVTESEGFDNVGSNGTPLPNGWTGTASGNYTTSTSSGVAIPSISLKNNGEWLQTKTYPYPVSKLTFMCRFPSASTGSSFVLDGLSNNNWTNIATVPYNASTSKFYPVYNFTKAQGMTAFKFTYNKVVGNLSLDDISVTYGSQDTTYIEKNKAVSTNAQVVSGLTPSTSYFYQVRATLGSSISTLSEIMKVNTSLTDAIITSKANPVKIFTYTDKITISGLVGNEQIQVYSLTGVCIYNQKITKDQLSIHLHQKGIYIVKVFNSDYRFTSKVKL